MIVPIRLAVHHHSDKLFVVDISLRILLVSQQLLNLLIAQFFTERGQQMPELSRRNEAARIFIEMTQALDEIVSSVARSLLRNCLKERKEREHVI
jgi:hypothetical protein